MTTGTARNGPVEIAYEVLGPPGGEPVLLIQGLGMQRIGWPDEFCAGLVDRGFTVARFDNRDCGPSTHFPGAPSLLSVLARAAAVAPYRLTDMADDAVAVLDALGWSSAHVVGVSLGGMIAQTLTIGRPARVRTLTSMMSTPAPQVGRATLRASAALARGAGVRSADEAGRRMVAVFRVIGSPGYPFNEEFLHDLGRRSYDRGRADPMASRRQLAAIRASGDRRRALAGLRLPALVLHGDADPLVRPAGGRATAAAIPGAKLVTFPGLGHDLPQALWPRFQSEIAAVAASAGTGRNVA